VQPTENKINILCKLFPDLDPDKLKKLYFEGVEEAQEISKRIMDELRSSSGEWEDA